MVGREAYQNPYMLAQVDAELFADRHPILYSAWVVMQMLPYIDAHPKVVVRRYLITLAYAGLISKVCRGLEPGARHLSENAPRKGADTSVLLAALKHVPGM